MLRSAVLYSLNPRHLSWLGLMFCYVMVMVDLKLGDCGRGWGYIIQLSSWAEARMNAPTERRAKSIASEVFLKLVMVVVLFLCVVGGGAVVSCRRSGVMGVLCGC